MTVETILIAGIGALTAALGILWAMVATRLKECRENELKLMEKIMQIEFALRETPRQSKRVERRKRLV